jgi:hypothetical protein
MAESKLVGGILVLTIEAFAAGQGHSDSGNHNARAALVKHRYHASKWPTMHPRYSHPVLGEVELCNWEPECVKIWDYNKALFESLPPEEQAKQIADKQAADALLAGSRLEARHHVNETGERNATEHKSHFDYTSTGTTKVVTDASAPPYS